MSLLIWVFLVGVGATLVMDVWALMLKHVLGVPSLDYALVGRWAGHMVRGRFTHEHIGKAEPVMHETSLGWAVHYATGIGFAALLAILGGAGWMAAPTPGLALAVGLGTVAAPFLLMQPGFGFGIAASKLPAPHIARLKSVVTHLIFGLGLYLASLGATPLIAS